MTDSEQRGAFRLVRALILVCFAAVALLLLLPASRLVEQSNTWLKYPYPRAGSEGLILYETLLVQRGEDIYAPITPERFISGPYPPVFYALAAQLTPSAPPDLSTPGQVESVFIPGRTVSLISAIAAALMVALLITLQSAGPPAKRWSLAGAAGGLVGGLLLLGLPQVLIWATRFRGDMLMLALTAGGLACIAAGAPPGRRTDRRMFGWLVLGAALFALAFFTKQTALAGPAAAAVYLLIRDRRGGLAWCAIMAAFVLAPATLLDLATNHWFYLKMVDYHSLPLRELTLTRLLRFAFWEDQWPVILAAAGYVLSSAVAAFRAWRAGTLNREPLLVPIFTTAALVMLPTGAVVGADHNHLLMPGLALAAAVGSALAFGLAGLRTARPPWLSVAALTAVLGLLAAYATTTSEPSEWYNPDLTPLSAEQQEQMRKIVLNVRQHQGTAYFSDDPGTVALAGKATPFDDPFTMTALAQQGRWDEGAYRAMLREGRFGLLVLSCDVFAGRSACRSDTFTEGVLDAIRDGYTLVFRDVLFTYAPRP